MTITQTTTYDRFFKEVASRHNSLCPRQVLGVRIGLGGAQALGMEVPRADKNLLVIVETDGCFVTGVSISTGCAVEHRTLRVKDYGKIAATFVDVRSGRAVRVAPKLDIRQRVWIYLPIEIDYYSAMLEGYQLMPTEELLSFQEVELITPIESIISRAGVRVNCEKCGEEIINEREIRIGEMLLCKACAGRAYFREK